MRPFTDSYESKCLSLKTSMNPPITLPEPTAHFLSLPPSEELLKLRDPKCVHLLRQSTKLPLLCTWDNDPLAVTAASFFSLDSRPQLISI